MAGHHVHSGGCQAFLCVKQKENIRVQKRSGPAKHLASLKAPHSAGRINTASSQQVWVNLVVTFKS